MRPKSLFLVIALFLMASPARAADLAGTWSGHWSDTKSGHAGPLRAAFCKCDEGHYRATFSGRFFKVIPFRYTVVLTVTGNAGDKILLTGEQRIPLFGTFSYTAEADAIDFVAHFCARRYQGDFVLRRGCP